MSLPDSISSFTNEDVCLKKFNSWKVGGKADYLALPKTFDEAKKALQWAKSESIEVSFLGCGSNVLISDRGVKGLVLCTKKLSAIEDTSCNEFFRLRCGAGALKFKVMRRFLKESLAPALFLSGLPGDVAAGVVMNAGVSEKELHPKEFVQVVESIKVLKEKGSVLEEYQFLNKDIVWSYRKSQGWGPGLITEVTLVWPKKDKVSDISERVLEAQNLRKSKQPLDLPSCGSVFTNPYNDPNNTEKKSAGALIEAAGLKGYEYGRAEISRKHANFIVNKGEASALDLHCALSLAQEKVRHMFDVNLVAEFRYLGDWEGLL